jgi:succinate dehydrogenase / fumarate reductase, membrane anchor subunit
MTKSKGLQAPLARARGWGSAKHGTGHWWAMRLTSLALVPLSLWFIFALTVCIASGSYSQSILWLQNPLPAALMALFLVVGFHHAANGLQTVIEDYVSCACLRMGSVIFVKFISVLLVVVGLLALGKIVFGG